MRILSKFLLVATLGVTPILGASVAQATATSAETDQQARELLLKGNQHFKKREWEKAYAAYLGAWGLKKHYSIAGNLADVEFKLERYKAAAEHLEYYLRELPPGRSERKAAETQLAQAKKHLAEVSVRVSVDGATIVIDGETVGLTPLARPILLEPGEHTIEARLAGHESASTSLSAVAGRTHDVELSPTKAGDPVPAGPGPKPPGGNANGPAATGPQDSGTGSNRGDNGSARTAVLLGGAAATGVAAAVAVGFLIKANGHQSDADEQLAAAKSQFGGNDPCSSAGKGSSRCTSLSSALDSRDAANTVEGIAWGVAGGFALATVATYFAWPSDAPSKAASRPALVVAPVYGPMQGGVVATGSF